MVNLKKYTTSHGTTYYHDLDQHRILRLGNYELVGTGGVHGTDILRNGSWRFILNHSEIKVGESIEFLFSGGDWVYTTPVVEIEDLGDRPAIHPYEEGSTSEDQDYD